MGIAKLVPLVVAGTMGVSSVHAGNKMPPQDKKPSKIEVPATKPEDKTTATTAQSKSVFDKKYKIGSRAEFDKLWKDAKPFVFVTLVAPENWHVDFYKDNGKDINTVGVGSYYVGVNSHGNLDFSANGKAIKTSKYVENYKKRNKGKKPKNYTPEELYLSYVWWWESMDNGAHLTNLYKSLKGAELTINEFSAIACSFYNNPDEAKKTCKYIVANYKSPRKCAHRIVKASDLGFRGIRARRVHEALVYLNYDNYCSEMFDKVKIDGHSGTSVSEEVNAHREILMSSFSDKNLSAAKKAIYDKKVVSRDKNGNVRTGKPIRSYIQTLPSKYSKPILAFADQKSSNSKSSTPKATGNFLVLYQQAGQRYTKGEYGVALELYKQALEDGGLFDDNLYNDMAMCCFHMKQYKKCIEYCKKTLNSGRRKAYMGATYNAGMAYWKLGDYDGAIRNFKAAVEYAKEFKDAKRQKVYETKLSECTFERGTKKVQQTKSQKSARNVYSNKQNVQNKSYNNNLVKR